MGTWVHWVIYNIPSSVNNPEENLANGTYLADIVLRSPNDIEEILELKQPNISQHLNLLRLLNIVDFMQDGNKKCYFLNNPKLIKDLLRVVKNIKITQAETANNNEIKKTLK